MKRPIILLLCLATVSCQKKWAGTYSGTINQFYSINTLNAAGQIGQTNSTNMGEVDVVITDGQNGKITVEYQGCKFDAVKSNSGGQPMATANSVDCPFPNAPGVTFHADMVSLTLTQDSLGWTWMGISHHGSDSGAFQSNFTGARKP